MPILSEEDTPNKAENGSISSQSEENQQPNKNISILKTIGLVVLTLIILLLTGFIIYQNWSGLAGTPPPTPLVSEKLIFNNTPIVVNQTPPKIEETCTTDVCAEAAVYLLHRIDPTVNPCDDFYDHACGKYAENMYLSDSGVTAYVESSLKLTKTYEKILNDNTTKTDSEKILKLVRKQCLDALNSHTSDFRDQLFTQLLKEVSKIGKSPILDPTWTEEDFDLTQFLINYSKTVTDDFGLFQFLHLHADGAKNESVLGVLVPQPQFGGKQNYTKDERIERMSPFLNKYSKILTHMLGVSPFDRDAVKALEQQILQVLYFETILEKPSMYGDISGELNYNDLKAYVPQIDWDKLVNSLVGGKANILKNKTKVHPKEYFTKYLSLLLNNTEPRVLANFLTLRWISKTISHIDGSGCTQTVMNLFPLNYVMTFAYRYIEFETIDAVTRMVADFKEEFIELIKKSSWMDEKSKKRAILKVEKMTTRVAYPNEFNETKQLDKRFETLKIKESAGFSETLMTILKWKTSKSWTDLVNDKESFFNITFYRTNAYYWALKNSLTIESPFVLMPFYDSDLPNFWNLGTLGHTIGHEMGHGFGTNGIKYDESGNDDTELFTNETMEEFEKIQKCFIDDYSSYKHPGFEKEQVYGNISVNENTADYIGLQLAYRLMKKQGNESKLPGLQQYNQMKLFFYNLASGFCHTPLDRAQFDMKNSDVHGLDRFRVNGVLSNFDGFSEVFGCKKGSKMNPAKKCSLF